MNRAVVCGAIGLLVYSITGAVFKTTEYAAIPGLGVEIPPEVAQWMWTMAIGLGTYFIGGRWPKLWEILRRFIPDKVPDFKSAVDSGVILDVSKRADMFAEAGDTTAVEMELRLLEHLLKKKVEEPREEPPLE